jgi:hypothetical protein
LRQQLIVLQWIFWVIGLSLQLLLTVTLWQRAGREFPALFAYIGCLVVTTTADILAYVVLGRASYYYRTYYWSAELLRQTALFSLVISLAMHMLPEGRRTAAFGRLIALTGGAIWLGSVALCYSTNLNNWMTSVARNLSFFTAALNLVAWFMFARVQPRDVQRLMIAGGLGLQMTGEAIGQAVRQMNVSIQVTAGGSIFIVLTHLLCLFIWWRALTLEPRYH